MSPALNAAPAAAPTATRPLYRATTGRDLLVTAAVLVALLLWDFSAADLVLTRCFGNAQGFAWRSHFITAGVLHEGGRIVAWATTLALLVCALRGPAHTVSGAVLGLARTPGRQERLYWWMVTLLCLLLVPAIKRSSATSCPWDLAEFGGSAHAVSHWLWGVADGGPGHCFPSGHAVAAFAFLSQYFLWRPHQPQRARAWLAAVLTAGLVFGLAQLARGAHHASHSAWSGFLCWAVCLLASAWRPGRGR